DGGPDAPSVPVHRPHVRHRRGHTRPAGLRGPEDVPCGCRPSGAPSPSSSTSNGLSARSVFFFEAGDGIRYGHVTGVQTCALPISAVDPGDDLVVDVVLVDIADEVVAGINRGESHIGDVPSEGLKPLVDSGRVTATTDYDVLKDADAILIALRTPLSSQREPDLSILTAAPRDIAPRPPNRPVFAPP